MHKTDFCEEETEKHQCGWSSIHFHPNQVLQLHHHPHCIEQSHSLILESEKHIRDHSIEDIQSAMTIKSMNVWIDMCLDHNIVIMGALYLDNIYILNKQFYILYKKYQVLPKPHCLRANLVISNNIPYYKIYKLELS